MAVRKKRKVKTRAQIRNSDTDIGFFLKTWLARNDLSIQDAADRLGVSARTFQYWRSDDAEAPKPIFEKMLRLACQKIEDDLNKKGKKR